MDEFEAEFRGLFWGEGCITVVPYRRRRGDRVDMLLRPQLGMTQRDDDAELLYELKRRLGGHVFHTMAAGKRGNRGGTLEWKVVQQEQIRNVCRILSGGVLPSKKRRELDRMIEYMDLVHTQGHKYTPEEKARLYEIAQALRDLKRYRSQDG